MIGLPLQGQGYLQYQEMSWTLSFETISTAASTSSLRELSPTALRQQTLARLSHTSGQLGHRYAARMPDGRETYRRLSVYACMRENPGAQATQCVEVPCLRQSDTRWTGACRMSDRPGACVMQALPSKKETGTSKLWLYRSTVDFDGDANAGLVGPLIVTNPAFALPSKQPRDVAQTFVTLFQVCLASQPHSMVCMS